MSTQNLSRPFSGTDPLAVDRSATLFWVALVMSMSGVGMICLAVVSLHLPVWLSFVISFPAGGVILALALRIATQPARQLAAVLTEVAAGDAFATPPFARESGVWGRLARSILTVRGFITETSAAEAERDALIAQKAVEARAVASMIDRFNAALTALLQAVKAARANLQEQTETLKIRADEAETNSRQIGRIRDGVTRESQSASQAVRQMCRKIELHADQSKRVVDRGSTALSNAAATTEMLADAAGRISKIVAEIGRLNAQTKLLALNATIEAVHAGEAGKGFGVVAAEVKGLSAQTVDAAQRIDQDIAFLQSAIGDTIGALDGIGAAIGEFNQLATDQIEALELAKYVDARTAQSAGSVETMAGNVAAVMSSSVATKAASHELEAVSSSLDAAFEGLTETVSGFLSQMRQGPIRVGILHSLSGTMAAAERPLTELLLMMIAELNRQGGLLGRMVEAVIMNPRSDWTLYAEMSRDLITRHGVVAIFGCWTSVSRKAVLPVLEQNNGLLFYPIQYEGQEQSPHIYYTGATPNQQAIPAIDFLMSPAGGGYRRFYLVGTDYIYPQVTYRILNAYLESRHIPGSQRWQILTPFSCDDWRGIVRDIKRRAAEGPLAVISTINGDANVYFYRELLRQGVSAARIPVMAFSIGENEAAHLGADLLNGHYVAWNYLMALDTPRNQAFIADWRAFTKNNQALTDDPMEATWIGFNLWCDAVRQAGSTGLDAVRTALAGRRILAPSGIEVTMDPVNHHLHKPLAIGQSTRDGSIKIVHYVPDLLPPEPENRYFVG